MSGIGLQLFWAGVRFAARNGDAEGLLSEAARQGLHLSSVSPAPGGFTACCAAWRYQRLAQLARRRRVRLRIQKRLGLYFRLRPYLQRHGLWAGALLFVPLLFWSQNLVWAVDVGSLSAGQQARAAVILQAQQLAPGAFVTQEKLATGEYALLQSGEFSWASLNFLDGRLIVEAATARPVPEIAAGTLDGIFAKAAGTVVRTELRSGTMLVSPGQAVEAGQPLIGTSRTRRDGTLILESAAGKVLAQLEWEHTQEEPLEAPVQCLTGKQSTAWVLCILGHRIPLPAGHRIPAERAVGITRHVQPELLGLTAPFYLEETTYYEQAEVILTYSEEQAMALARLHSLQALDAVYPDAELLAQNETASAEQDILRYQVRYTIVADLCAQTADGRE